MSADTKIKLCLLESRDRQNIKLARPSFTVSLFPTFEDIGWILSHESKHKMKALVSKYFRTIMTHLWHPSAPHWSREFTAHFRHIGLCAWLAFRCKWVALSTPQKSNALTLPLDRLLRYQVASSKNSEMYLFLACTVTQPRRNEKIIWKPFSGKSLEIVML